MKNIALKLFILILLTPFYCCSSNKSDLQDIFKENNHTFNTHKTVLNDAVNYIEKFYSDSTTAKGYEVNYMDSLPVNIKNNLQNIGIDGISIQNMNDAEQVNYQISFNLGQGWNTDKLRFVQLIYAPNNKNTVKGFHHFDGHHIDIWGQGDNFYIISNTDWL